MHNIILHLSLYYPLPSSETEKRDGNFPSLFSGVVNMHIFPAVISLFYPVICVPSVRYWSNVRPNSVLRLFIVCMISAALSPVTGVG